MDVVPGIIRFSAYYHEIKNAGKSDGLNVNIFLGISGTASAAPHENNDLLSRSETKKHCPTIGYPLSTLPNETLFHTRQDNSPGLLNYGQKATKFRKPS